jgi:hypothetical protein
MTPRPNWEDSGIDGSPAPLFYTYSPLPDLPSLLSPIPIEDFEDIEDLRLPLTRTDHLDNNGEQIDDNHDDGISEDDSITSTSAQISDDGGYGDEEEVDVAADSYTWKIDHSKGDHKLHGESTRHGVLLRRQADTPFAVEELLSMVHDPRFDSRSAIDMLQRRYTIDYGSRHAGCRSAGGNDEFHPLFFLDMIIVVGRPLLPIAQMNDRFFDNVTISFKNWRSSYSCKHIHGFSFDLQHRTFRFATAATRESWFIVMHPTGNVFTEFPASRRNQRKKAEQSSRSSALRPCHAQFLATYIKQIFLGDELLGEGVEASWILDGPQSQTITFNKWTKFQQRFMDHWDAYVTDETDDAFWYENQPAFHAYDYGANIEIQVNDYLQSLGQELSIRPAGEDSEDDSDLVAGRQRHEPTSISADESQGHETTSGRCFPGESDPTRDRYPPGLAELHTELERKYVIDNVDSISFALAVDLNCLDIFNSEEQHPPARCLLADRNLVAPEYRGTRDFTFYPLAFHPAYGNFSSPRPPAFLNDHVLAVMRDNMSYRNGGTDPLTYGYFQAYSNIKRSIRHGPDDLLVTKGIVTAALALPESEAQASRRVQVKWQKLQRQLRGQLTPDDPDASRPFAREQRRVEAAMDGEEFAFRMEQVVCVHVSRLVRSQRRFATVLQPILRLMRFYLQEPECYAHLLRSFPPAVFPGVLSAYAHLFDVAVTEFRKCVEGRGSAGPSVALAEGLAALDRLGSYCFTGFPRSLMGSVLKPLGTIESIEQGAWPYITPALLDLHVADAQLNVALWPRGEKGRPILMHVAALAYHYGSAVAISRQNHVWFEELGGRSVTGPSGITEYLAELFQELWMPQMVGFVKHHVEGILREGDRSKDTNTFPARDPLSQEQRRGHLDRWSQSRYPFSWM